VRAVRPPGVAALALSAGALAGVVASLPGWLLAPTGLLMGHSVFIPTAKPTGRDAT